MNDNTDKLPDVQQGLLDPATLQKLASDIEACGDLIDVSVKNGASQRAAELEGGRVDLQRLFARVASGEVRGVQVRYQFEGVVWWDTLLYGEAGVRLTRIAHPF